MRFDADGMYYPDMVMRRNGILPSMASNRPFHGNQDVNWETMTPIERTNIACYAEWYCEIYWCPPCDSGHRLLLVYSGDLNWVNSGKFNLEDFTEDPFWMGSTINYVLFRPGDNKVFYEGTLADITGYEDYDPQKDHAIYPEVVWNAGTRQWIVTWEEMRKKYDEAPCASLPECRATYRYARTIDEDGNLGPVQYLGRCYTSDTMTSTGEKGDEPPALPYQKNYCYYVNAASDHYSESGIPLANRNPEHLSLHDSYMYEFGTSNIPRWLSSDANKYVENPYDQEFNGHPHMANISVIGWPTPEDWGYPNASYLMFKSKQVNDDSAVQNEFFLLVDQPDHAFSPPTYQYQEAPQQFYHELAGTVDESTTRRFPLATSSGLFAFMALWSQPNASTGKMEVMYGNYYFQQE